MPGERRERVGLTAGLGVLLAAIALTGACGTAEKPAARATRSPDQATSQCRAKWADLAQRIEGNQRQEEPSALADRWNSVVATADYYATSARSGDCTTRLDDQEKAISRLRSFEKSLQPWDMEHQLSDVETRADAYASSPRPKPSTGKKGGDSGGKDSAPSPAAVKKALATLRRLAPTATEDQRPGWQQAEVVDLQDESAVKKARNDLDFLSHQSKAWRSCDDAVRLIRKALRA